MLGVTSFCELPFSVHPLEPFFQLGESVLYVADRAYISRPDDDPSNVYFESRLLVPIRFERSLLSGDGLSGPAALGFGDVEIVNTDGFYDHLAGDFSIDGRSVVLRMGSPSQAYTDFDVVFRGTAANWQFSQEKLVVAIRDYTLKLQTPIQATTYAGTGELEGNSNLAGRPKPLVFGRCLNVTPVVVDDQNLIYQFHSGEMFAVDVIYDRGVALLPSQYVVNLTAGTVQLLNAPAGTITGDVRGHSPGGVYADRLSSIVRAICAGTGGWGSVSVDGASLAALSLAVTGEMGVYISDSVQVSEVLDSLMRGVGGWFGFTLTGELQAAVLEAPSESYQHEFTPHEIVAIERLAPPSAINPPNWRRRLGYRRNWTVQNDGDLGGDATSSGDPVGGLTRRNALKESYLIAEASAASIKLRHPLATDPAVVEGHFLEYADAQAEAERQLELYREDRSIFRITLKTEPFVVELGDEVLITYSRWGLTDGAVLRVIGVVEDIQGGVTELTMFR